MDLNLLKVFLELYTLRSLSKTARRLGVSQPSVSRRLQALRETFNDPLFVSDGHELQPTQKAVQLYPETAKAYQAVKLVFEIGGEHKEPKCTIACSDDFELFIGPKIIERFREKIPTALLIFHQTNTLFAEKTLLEREANFCLTGGGTHSNQVAREGFGLHEDVCLYSSEDKSPLSLEEYIQREHVAVHFGGAEGVADEILRRRKNPIKRKLVAITSHYGGIENYLLGTNRVAIVPLFLARKLINKYPELCFCKLPFNAIQDQVELSYRKDVLKDPFLSQCRDVLAELLKETDWN